MPTTPIVLWVDATLAQTGPAEIPGLFLTHFDIDRCPPAGIEEAIRRLRPAALLIDYDFPDRDGLQLAVDIKRLYPSLPIVVMLVQHSEALAVWALRSGMMDYLVKPARPADVSRVARLIREISTVRRGQAPRASRGSAPLPPPEARLSVHGARRSLLPAIYYVRQHYGGKIMLEEVADVCGMKSAQMSRLFRTSYGLTFRTYLVRYRLRQARRLLRDPRVTVSSVAETVGFNDPSHFSRTFKRHFGVQPSERPAEQSNGGGDEVRP